MKERQARRIKEAGDTLVTAGLAPAAANLKTKDVDDWATQKSRRAAPSLHTSPGMVSNMSATCLRGADGFRAAVSELLLTFQNYP
jgi:hypothetical protein